MINNRIDARKVCVNLLTGEIMTSNSPIASQNTVTVYRYTSSLLTPGHWLVIPKHFSAHITLCPIFRMFFYTATTNCFLPLWKATNLTSFFSLYTQKEAISNTLADTYQRLYELPDLKLPVKYPRTPGYRPSVEENPYNAWYSWFSLWLCIVRYINNSLHQLHRNMLRRLPEDVICSEKRIGN